VRPSELNWPGLPWAS